MNQSDNETLRKGIDFLIEDFKDSSEHLRTTQRKMEFPFQIYSAVLAILFTQIPSIIEINKEKMGLVVNLWIYLIIVLLVVNFIFLEWCLRALKNKNVYINRLNFLRQQIYSHTHIIGNGKKPDNFYWVRKMSGNSSGQPTSKFKIGLNDIIPFALMFLELFLFVLLWFWRLPVFFDVKFTQTPLFIIIGIIFLFLFIIYFSKRWESINTEVKKQIDRDWIDYEWEKGVEESTQKD